MFCISCGQQLRDGATFCPCCGSAQYASAAYAANATASASTNVNTSSGTTGAVGGIMGSVVNGVSDRFDQVYGTTEHVDLSFLDFFSEVFKRHTPEESEEIFITGTSKTTPDIRDAPKTWHKPWFYSRVLALLLVAFAGCVVIWQLFNNPIVLPSIMVFGSFAVPLACLIFFFEANAEQNISFIKVLRSFVIGGVMSLIVYYPISVFFPGSGTGEMMPALLTGIVEELAKASVVAFIIRRSGRHVGILNGLVIGAAVGAGFAAFESAGYAFNAYSYRGISDAEIQGYLQQLGLSGETMDGYWYILATIGYPSMIHNIILRGFLAVGGHVAWAAVEGAGMAIASGDRPLKWSDLFKKEFLILLVIPVLCHGYWDWAPMTNALPIPYLEQIALIVIIWIVLLVLLRRGLAEVNQRAREA